MKTIPPVGARSPAIDLHGDGLTGLVPTAVGMCFLMSSIAGRTVQASRYLSNGESAFLCRKYGTPIMTGRIDQLAKRIRKTDRDTPASRAAAPVERRPISYSLAAAAIRRVLPAVSGDSFRAASVSSGMSTVISLVAHSVLRSRDVPLMTLIMTLSVDMSRSEDERWTAQDVRLSVHPQRLRNIPAPHTVPGETGKRPPAPAV